MDRSCETIVEPAPVPPHIVLGNGKRFEKSGKHHGLQMLRRDANAVVTDKKGANLRAVRISIAYWATAVQTQLSPFVVCT